ncbi:hypothetical protein BTO20_19495 [Mycobacterium dioxanotrophicus]|uniref:Uncharacterized protein n=2 Tax=Mycobacteriaceae TaxID=1762 RepID=A0A1Y0C5I4_9MYCO|nr:hypothetical protein BTO20_19495 [Mycobacterium dioxanotrophicus]OMB81860.1 hypothetical protein A5741_24550 [Mycolicibacterium conceptionense]
MSGHLFSSDATTERAQMTATTCDHLVYTDSEASTFRQNIDKIATRAAAAQAEIVALGGAHDGAPADKNAALAQVYSDLMRDIDMIDS